MPPGIYKRPTHDELFWRKVDKNGPNVCWNWKGHICTRFGYGKCHFAYKGKIIQRAHRASWVIAGRELIDGLSLDHLCRNRACVNPNHLEQVTGKENVLRGVGPTAINAKKTHCKRGHELSGHNLKICRKTKYRNCRICFNVSVKQYKKRLKKKQL